jgi:hypothetical protein
MMAWRLIRSGTLAPQEDPLGNPEMELIHFRVPYQGTLMAYPLRLPKSMNRWVAKPLRFRDFKDGECIRINGDDEPEGADWFEGKLRGRR